MACPTRIISGTRVGNLLLGEVEIATAPPGQTLSVPGKVLTKKNGLLHPTPLWWIDAPFSFNQYDQIDSGDGLLKRFLKVEFTIPYDGSTGEPQEPDPGAVYEGYFLVEDEAENQVQVDFCLGIPTEGVSTTTIIFAGDFSTGVIAKGVLTYDATAGEYSVSWERFGTMTFNYTSDLANYVWYDSNTGNVIICDEDPATPSEVRIRVCELDDPDGTITTIIDGTDGWGLTRDSGFGVIGSEIYFMLSGGSGYLRKVNQDGTGATLIVAQTFGDCGRLLPGDTGELVTINGTSLTAYSTSDGSIQHSASLGGGGIGSNLLWYDEATGYIYWGQKTVSGAAGVRVTDEEDLTFIEDFRDPAEPTDAIIGHFAFADVLLSITNKGSGVYDLRGVEKDGSSSFLIQHDLDAEIESGLGAAFGFSPTYMYAWTQ